MNRWAWVWLSGPVEFTEWDVHEHHPVDLNSWIEQGRNREARIVLLTEDPGKWAVLNVRDEGLILIWEEA